MEHKQNSLVILIFHKDGEIDMKRTSLYSLTISVLQHYTTLLVLLIESLLCFVFALTFDHFAVALAYGSFVYFIWILSEIVTG